MSHPMSSAELTERLHAERVQKLNQRIATLTAERDTLALQVVQMREALEDNHGGMVYIRRNHGELYGVGFDRAAGKAEAALAITPTAAEAQVEEWKRKADLLEWLFEADDFLRVSALYDAWNGEDSFLDYCRAAREKASDAGK